MKKPTKKPKPKAKASVKKKPRRDFSQVTLDVVRRATE
jgi:hypothetical protein